MDLCQWCYVIGLKFLVVVFKVDLGKLYMWFVLMSIEGCGGVKGVYFIIICSGYFVVER